jgi:surface antigen
MFPVSPGSYWSPVRRLARRLQAWSRWTGAPLALVAALAVAADVPASIAHAAPESLASASPAAASSCECVAYVKHHFGLSGTLADARYMGPGLQARGFRQVTEPRVGAVVIFQPSFGPDISQQYGHVGIIERVRATNQGRDWRLTVRGANQGGQTTTEDGCTNVASVTFRAYPKTSTAVAYYVR